jgi:SAM-dependent methyltransferase
MAAVDGADAALFEQAAGAVMSESYKGREGYVPEADLNLGCGVPTDLAAIGAGMTVLDLGSGAGNDAFVSAAAVGPGGRVIGVDMTPEMIARANANRDRVRAANVEFRLGEIEALPVDDASVDVVISNCVLNLVPDKRKAFAEIHRVLKPGGWFCVSDIVLEGEMPDELRSVAALYAGCVSGAVQLADYLGFVAGAGFERHDVPRSRSITIPPALLIAAGVLPDAGGILPGGARIASVTVRGWKRA